MRGMLFSLLCQQALKRKGRPSGLIGQYKPYLNSNDSPTRDILKDYSGNGHDIQLYNFAFAENSGYGKYVRVYLGGNTSLTSIKLKLYNYSKVVMTRTTAEGEDSVTIYEYRISPGDSVPVTKVKITGLTGSGVVLVKYSSFANNDDTDYISEDGIYTFKSVTNSGSGTVYPGLKLYSGYDIDCNIVIEQIPEYKGALVSDGVDDYGLCDNFPILTKEKGYTVCALRKILSSEEKSRCLVTNYNNNALKGAFQFEAHMENLKSFAFSFGKETTITSVDNLFTYQTSVKYNNKDISKGDIEGYNVLKLFNYYASASLNYCFPYALYALEIYDHDLTDEEIEKVKEAMYDEYLTATNALQNHIIADYECYDKTNEDEDRDVLKDLSGKGIMV